MLAFAHDALDGRIFLREARLLARAGHAVRVVGRGRALHSFRSFEQDGIRLVVLPRRPASMALRLMTDPLMFAWFLVVAMVRGGRAAVYHCHEYQSLLAGWLVARMRGARVVYDCHEFQPETFGFQCASLGRALYEPARRCFERFERFVNRRVDAAMVAHEGLLDRFRRDCGLVVVFPNYPSLDLADRKAPPPADLARKMERKTVLLFSGYIDPLRGVDNILRVLAPLKKLKPDAHLLLVGECADDYRAELRRLGARLGVADDVTFAGRFNEDQLAGFLKLGKLGMLLLDSDYPWHRYSEGTKFFQYAAAGLPVVVSRLPIYERLSAEGGNGLVVDPRVPDEVARQIAALLGDPDRMSRMASAGKEAFVSRWNLAAIEGRLLELYGKLER
ncbi:MAG: glycosyltransferase [Verrucomicrobiota bacterium]|nr:glycosyltransferase [Verrucomicrobiota bacterium]